MAEEHAQRRLAATDRDYVYRRQPAAHVASFGATLDRKLVGFNFAINWGSVGFFGPLTVLHVAGLRRGEDERSHCQESPHQHEWHRENLGQRRRHRLREEIHKCSGHSQRKQIDSTKSDELALESESIE